MEMKPSEVLRVAAELVARGDHMGGCSAIIVATWSAPCAPSVRPILESQARHYFDFFKPKEDQHMIFWWPAEKNHGPRVLGLLLAAAIAESEGQ